ncbi:MAG: alpha/beta hydrolase [Planctomycetia bacterium]
MYRHDAASQFLWIVVLAAAAGGPPLPFAAAADFPALDQVSPVELLWPAGAPGAVGSAAEQTDLDKPAVAVLSPAALPNAVLNAGTAVVVCPGGGYGVLAMGHEGVDVARWLAGRGVVAVVLRYRLAPRYQHPSPLQDVQRALRWTRANAERLGVKEDRVGVWGFSAGGHLASTVSTHFDEGTADAPDPVDRKSCRPDFAVLAYPVISLAQPFTHAGSRRNLLGEKPDPALVESLSNDTQVTSRTPPTFLFHTGEDKAVPPENSIAYYSALRKAGVPAEMHIYQSGVHGVGLAAANPLLADWPDRLRNWMTSRNLLSPSSR